MFIFIAPSFVITDFFFFFPLLALLVLAFACRRNYFWHKTFMALVVALS